MKKTDPSREKNHPSLKKAGAILNIAIALLILGMQAFAGGTTIPPAAQQLTVSGTITDSETGEPMPGVNIVVKGTNIGSISDISGKYSLSSINGNATVVFSFIGYVTQEIPLNNRTTVDVRLVSEIKGLEEVVVVGYGTQKKVNLTGSVSSISSDVLENRPVPNVGTALLGVSPNLNIELSGYGGEPGASVNWNIRGMGSISGNDSPLILVDGVEMDISNLDPSNIESI